MALTTQTMFSEQCAGCRRRVAAGGTYCCAPCRRQHQGVDDPGAGAPRHSAACDLHDRRGELSGAEPA